MKNVTIHHVEKDFHLVCHRKEKTGPIRLGVVQYKSKDNLIENGT